MGWWGWGNFFQPLLDDIHCVFEKNATVSIPSIIIAARCVFETNAKAGHPSSVIFRSHSASALAPTILIAVDCELHVRIKRTGRKVQRTHAYRIPSSIMAGPFLPVIAFKFTSEATRLQQVVECMPMPFVSWSMLFVLRSMLFVLGSMLLVLRSTSFVIGSGGSGGDVFAHLGSLCKSSAHTA